jgi:hypothetical protein
MDRLHIRVHLWWVSRWTRRLLVVTGARCPLTKPVVTAVELQATTEPHCSRGVQPGGIACVCVGAARADSRRSGVGLAPRPQALPMPAAAQVLYIPRATKASPRATKPQQALAFGPGAERRVLATPPARPFLHVRAAQPHRPGGLAAALAGPLTPYFGCNSAIIKRNTLSVQLCTPSTE